MRNIYRKSVIMKLVKSKQELTLPLIETLHNNESVKHGQLLPNQIRALITGPSGSGKTNVMIGLLIHPHGLQYQNVCLISKTAFQPLYDDIQTIINGIPGMSFTCNDEEEFKPDSIVIFDDVAPESFQQLQNCFSFGRHSKIDVFYLVQTYVYCPRTQVRVNANVIILFKQDERNLRTVFNDHVIGDMSFSTFKEMCQTAWNDHPFSFLTIVKDFPLNDGRYRTGLDKFFTSIN